MRLYKLYFKLNLTIFVLSMGCSSAPCSVPALHVDDGRICSPPRAQIDSGLLFLFMHSTVALMRVAIIRMGLISQAPNRERLLFTKPDVLYTSGAQGWIFT